MLNQSFPKKGYSCHPAHQPHFRRQSSNLSFVSTSSFQLDPELSVQQFLTSAEKAEIELLQAQLDALEIPQRPPGAFMLFKKTFQSLVAKDQHFYSTKDFCRYLKQKYDSMSNEERSKFEEESQQKYDEYLEQFRRVEEKTEEIREQIENITNRANYTFHTKRKKVSAYRVFKKDIAEKIKNEFPKMNNSERQMIVRERWRNLDNSEKALFVHQARYLEEKKHYDSI